MQQGVPTEGPVTKVNIGRLTNSIFVFTLLLLFKNIRIPGFGDVLDQTSANEFGAMQIPDIMSFLVAFLIIAMIWIITFHTFHMMTRIDRHYLYTHLVMLMLVIMIPVSSHYTVIFPGKSIFPTFFHTVMLVLGLLLFLEWQHILRTPAIFRSNVSGWQCRCITIKMLLIPATACIGIVLASLDLPATQYIYFITMAGFAILSACSWKNLASCRREIS